MRKASKRRSRLVVVVLAVVLGLSIAGIAGAQQGPSVVRSGQDRVQATVEQRFQVVPLRQGLMLLPKGAAASYRSIEITEDGGVLIDGTPVTGRELRGRLPADAELVTQLSLMSEDARRAMFPAGSGDKARTPGAEAEEPAGRVPDSAELPSRDAGDEGWTEIPHTGHAGGARVRIGGGVEVKEGEVAGDAVVAILGSVRVEGRVEGDVVAVGGGVYLGPHAYVRGDVVAVGGAIERAPGARVFGEINDVRIGFPAVGPWVRLHPFREWSWFGRQTMFGASEIWFASLMRMAVLALLAAMFVAIGGRGVRRITSAVEAEPWRAGFAGLAAQIFFVPVFVLTVVVLAVSIIGIPLLLLVPFALLLAICALIVGFAATSCAVGETVGRWAGNRTMSPLASLIVGLAVVWALTFLARLGGLMGGPARAVLTIVLVGGFIVEYVVWTIGLGGVLLTRFGRRNTVPDVSPAEPVAPSGPAMTMS
jgi:hypothetical protein